MSRRLFFRDDSSWPSWKTGPLSIRNINRFRCTRKSAGTNTASINPIGAPGHMRRLIYRQKSPTAAKTRTVGYSREWRVWEEGGGGARGGRTTVFGIWVRCRRAGRQVGAPGSAGAGRKDKPCRAGSIRERERPRWWWRRPRFERRHRRRLIYLKTDSYCF